MRTVSETATPLTSAEAQASLTIRRQAARDRTTTGAGWCERRRAGEELGEVRAHKNPAGTSAQTRNRPIGAAAVAFALVCLISPCRVIGQDGQLSEQDFLAEIPHVISASRLPQAPSDSPAVVTVIDREMIRASGARDLAELFQLVPGFHWGTPRGGRDVVAYHGLSGQFSQRMQVLLNGRSLYAPYLFGGVDWASLTITLDDIDYIEVLRGSNSATYGANAFLGVANIVTRTAAQSVGALAQVSYGNNGIVDTSARIASDYKSLHWRLSAGSRRDNGLENTFDDNSKWFVDLGAELQLNATDELSLAAGMTRGDYGIGFENNVGDPPRTEALESKYGLLRWRRSLSPTHEISVTYYHTEDTGSDRYEIPVTPTTPLVIDYGRRASRDSIDYQQYFDLARDWRVSWGAQYQRETLWAPQLFNTEATLRTDAASVFANFEWRPSVNWTLNFGGLVEHDQDSGNNAAPRAVANWKPMPGQTFRLGYSRAFRPPSLFEQKSDWRFIFQGQTIDIRFLSRGGLQAETVDASELSYLGEWSDLGLRLDARLFDERVGKLILPRVYSLPPGEEFNPESDAYDLRNAGSAHIRGLSYQLRLRPTGRWSLIFSHYMAKRSASEDYLRESIAPYTFSLLGTFGLTERTRLSGGVYVLGPVRWIGEADTIGRAGLGRLRLEHSLKLAGANGTIALTARVPFADKNQFRDGQIVPNEFWATVSVSY